MHLIEHVVRYYSHGSPSKPIQPLRRCQLQCLLHKIRTLANHHTQGQRTTHQHGPIGCVNPFTKLVGLSGAMTELGCGRYLDGRGSIMCTRPNYSTEVDCQEKQITLHTDPVLSSEISAVTGISLKSVSAEPARPPKLKG